MRGAGAARVIPLVAAGAAAASGVLILVVAADAPSRAREHATREEARAAASLYELPGATEADVLSLLDGRARIVAPEAGGAGPGAHAYRAGALEPAAWIAVEPRDEGSRWPWAPSVLALLGALCMAAWAAGRRRSPPPPRFPAAPAFLCAAMFALVAVTAQQWARGELEAISTSRLAGGLRAAEIAGAAGADPEAAARVAGLPWASGAALGEPDRIWTMPREVGAAIAAAPRLRTAPRYTVAAGGATYHGGSIALGPGPPVRAEDPANNLHLVFLGYEETTSPAVALIASSLGCVLLVSLVLFLLPLAARPRALSRTLAAWGFLTPAAALLLLFTFGPLLFSLWISLHDWRLVDPAHPFLGLANYRALLGDGAWWSAVRNTGVFTLHVPLAMAVALSLALLTRESRRAVRWARLALFLPSITSVVAIAVVWKWLLNDGYGLANRALGAIGLGPVAWLSSPDIALVSLMVIGVWMVVGYQMVVFQAGLAAIPRVWYDAARVDGAGPWQRFRHITLPGLRHTLFFVLVTSVIGSFQVFGLVYVMTEGGPLGATDVAVYHIYREAWEFLRFGNAAAMSWILFGVVFAATWLHFRFLERRGAHA
ncbi:MAG: sugar ABC transporter permease [Acidobacteriota bacterium]|nr:sugar ABC transporter permease [Acidobacteriota bacterium]